MRYVIDASVAAEYLLRTSLGLRASELIEGESLLAPELLDIEVLSVLRRAVLKKKLDEECALMALEDLLDWEINRIPHIALAQETLRFRHNVSAYDAFYVSATRIYNPPLLTADGPLPKTQKIGIVIHNIRIV